MSFKFGSENVRPAFDRETPRVSSGLRFPEACLHHCRDTFASSRVYVICSKSIADKTDALARLKAALGDDRIAGVRIGISPHTPIAQVVETIADARRHDVDCIVTLGAGSLTDAAKIVRLALANGATTEEELLTLWGTTESNPSRRKHIEKPVIPLIHIPTSLSGGEYQAIAGGTESQGHAKRSFNCEGVDPELVIQDPELCLTTPEWVWLSTGMRAVDHCVETLCSLRSNPRGDEWAGRGLRKLVAGLLQSKADPTSLQARHLCQLGVVEAMCAVSSGVPLGASHAIGHQLGPLGVGHGQTSCILLPAVCKFNLGHKANVEHQANTKAILAELDVVRDLVASSSTTTTTTTSSSSSPSSSSPPRGWDELDLGDILGLVISALGMPRTLQDVGLDEDCIGTLARNSLEDIWIKTNAVPITEESQVREILDMCIRK